MKEREPLVSIIVPNYNHEKYLKQRLESVFNQTYPDFEVILLDDCSTDKSPQLLQTYANHPKVSHLIVNTKNSGSPFRQWQKGIKLAKGKYIWIAESDDYCALNFLDKMMPLFTHDHSIGLSYCQTVDVNEKGDTLFHRIQYTNQFQPNIWEVNFVKDGRQFIQTYLSSFNVIPNASAVIFKKQLISDTFFSDFLLQMHMCGDWLFWTQILLESKVAFVSETLNYFRNHKGISRNHHSLANKKQRLIEEKQVRAFLQDFKIYNKKREQALYYRWFKIHPFKTVLFSSFYDIKLPNTSFKNFIQMYIWYKLKTKVAK